MLNRLKREDDLPLGREPRLKEPFCGRPFAKELKMAKWAGDCQIKVLNN